MTRAALRMLNRARADAWRRVGIPERWEGPGADSGAPEAAETPAADTQPGAESQPPANQSVKPYMRQSYSSEATGKNVAGPGGDNVGTGRPANANGNATSNENER